MAYAAVSDIQNDFKNQDFTSSGALISSSTVTTFIAEADSMINSYLNQRYTTPVTSGEAVTFLKMLSRSLVAARIKSILQVKSEDKNVAQAVQGGAGLYSFSQAIKVLEDLRDNKMALIGANALVSSVGFFSNNVANGVTPVMTKDDKEW